MKVGKHLSEIFWDFLEGVFYISVFLGLEKHYQHPYLLFFLFIVVQYILSEVIDKILPDSEDDDQEIPTEED